jgi:hypothetical protein
MTYYNHHPTTGGVKKELPEIDCTILTPPPGPGDDLLLLSGRLGVGLTLILRVRITDK